jgi:hypothetical protein
VSVDRFTRDERQVHDAIAVLLCSAILLFASCSRPAPAPSYRTFAEPEEAVRALIDVVAASKLDDLLVLFGPDSAALIESSDPATGRKNREVFTAAVAENWHLIDSAPDQKVLIIGNEEWPFPVPLTKDANRWRFDTAAGKEEVLARRIGRNELAVMRVCRTYVAAQHQYAEQGHDGKPAGLYARTFASDAGKQNGLYWPDVRGQARSPLGDLVAEAAQEGRKLGPDRQQQQTPFHGYYFRILTAQGAAASGGEKTYLVNGDMSAGFALVAWPAQYDESGVMTFVVNQNGTVYEKDLGGGTDEAARAMTLYNPDDSWEVSRQ